MTRLNLLQKTLRALDNFYYIYSYEFNKDIFKVEFFKFEIFFLSKRLNFIFKSLKIFLFKKGKKNVFITNQVGDVTEVLDIYISLVGLGESQICT